MKKTPLEKMCTSKHRYVNYQAALKIAKVLRKKRKMWFAVYKCPACYGWHLTKRGKFDEQYKFRHRSNSS